LTAGILPILSRLTTLGTLGLRGLPIGDDDLLQHSWLSRVTSLDLGETLVTGHGLAHVTATTSLRKLFLDRCAITDAGAQHLGALKEN
jgi:hypothetical protein